MLGRGERAEESRITCQSQGQVHSSRKDKKTTSAKVRTFARSEHFKKCKLGSNHMDELYMTRGRILDGQQVQKAQQSNKCQLCRQLGPLRGTYGKI